MTGDNDNVEPVLPVWTSEAGGGLKWPFIILHPRGQRMFLEFKLAVPATDMQGLWTPLRTQREGETTFLLSDVVLDIYVL